jgi:hypothetical protein
VLRAHIVQVHKLGVARVVAAGEHVRHGPGRVERGYAGYAAAHGVAVKLYIFGKRVVVKRAGVDHKTNLASFISSKVRSLSTLSTLMPRLPTTSAVSGVA